MKKNNKSSILNIAISFFSILLIVLGLFFIYLGVKDIFKANNDANTSTDNTGNINIGISITKSPEEIKNDGIITAQEKSLRTQERIRATGRWIATDYVSGDISKGDYIVKQGDTLWEIAEAVYGDGLKWTKILERNKSSIGKLPNGQQALIWPGQVLVIE